MIPSDTVSGPEFDARLSISVQVEVIIPLTCLTRYYAGWVWTMASRGRALPICENVLLHPVPGRPIVQQIDSLIAPIGSCPIVSPLDCLKRAHIVELHLRVTGCPSFNDMPDCYHCCNGLLKND
jgi:hypothetical protein